MGQMKQLPNGQRVGGQPVPTQAPVALPPQPGLGALSQQLMMQRALPSRPVGPGMLPMPTVQPTLEDILIQRQLGQQ